MRSRGVVVIVGSFALAGLLLVLWLVGLVFGVGGALIHILLLFAPVVVAAGVALGVLLIAIDKGQNQR
jgi:hypothetical protein